MMKTNALLTMTLGALLASQTAVAAPRIPKKASGSAVAAKVHGDGTAGSARRTGKRSAKQIKVAPGAAQAQAVDQRPSTMVGGAKGAALVAAAVAQGASTESFGKRWRVSKSGRAITVFEVHEGAKGPWLRTYAKGREQIIESDLPDGVAAFVFTRGLLSKTYQLSKAVGPRSWANIPATDPAQYAEGKLSPGPEGRFRVIPFDAGETIDVTYARALSEAKRTNTPVVAIHNAKIMTVYANSPATIQAYEAKGNIPELRKDL